MSSVPFAAFDVITKFVSCKKSLLKKTHLVRNDPRLMLLCNLCENYSQWVALLINFSPPAVKILPNELQSIFLIRVKPNHDKHHSKKLTVAQV